MRQYIKLIAIAAFIVPFLSSCFDSIVVSGNREIAEEEREIPEFAEITSSGNFNVFYEYAEEASLTVVAESNLIPYIETAVFRDKLEIGTPNHVSIIQHSTVEVYVRGPYVEKIKLSGSGVIETDTVRSRNFEIKVSGSGDVYTSFIGESFSSSISGSGKMYLYADCINCDVNVSGFGRIEIEGLGDKLDLSISGSGKVDAYYFPVFEAFANISGSGNVYVNVSDYLRANISGSGDVYYVGRPTVDINSSGSGRVINDN